MLARGGGEGRQPFDRRRRIDHDELGDGLPRALAESGVTIITVEATQSNTAGHCVEVDDVTPLPIVQTSWAFSSTGANWSSTAARLAQ